MDLNQFGEPGLAMKGGLDKHTPIDEVHCRTRHGDTVRVARHQVDNFPNVSASLGIVRLCFGLRT